MSLKETLKKIPGLHRAGQAVKYFLLELRASMDLLRERRIRRSGAIRVGFLCQYLPAWDKLEPTYRAMVADPRFEPVLICIPSGIENNRLTDPDCTENDTWKAMVDKGYPEAVNALTGREQWLDPETLEMHYVFCVRPYDHFMPPEYTTKALSRHCRICLVLYGMPFSEEDCAIGLNRPFMSRLYLHFADNEDVRARRLRQHGLKHRLGLQRTVCVGLPAGETILGSRGEESPSWAFAKGEFRVMWTPRWTTDPKVGGTNFFLYKDALLDYAGENPQMDLLLRPHPLMFRNFQKIGAMTAAQAEDYKARVAALPNVAFDPQPRYDATFWGTDVLVSDISGMIPEFLFTGKPLIFCGTNMEIELVAPMKQLLDVCYTANNTQELFDRLNRLRAGEDPLAARRQETVRQILGGGERPSAQILETLWEDQNQ